MDSFQKLGINHSDLIYGCFDCDFTAKLKGCEICKESFWFADGIPGDHITLELNEPERPERRLKIQWNQIRTRKQKAYMARLLQWREKQGEEVDQRYWKYLKAVESFDYM